MVTARTMSPEIKPKPIPRAAEIKANAMAVIWIFNNSSENGTDQALNSEKSKREYVENSVFYCTFFSMGAWTRLWTMTQGHPRTIGQTGYKLSLHLLIWFFWSFSQQYDFILIFLSLVLPVQYLLMLKTDATGEIKNFSFELW